METLLHYRDNQDYLLHEFVVMPDHLHLLMTPSETTSLEKCVQLIKGGSSFRIHKARGLKMEIWQIGFHDWTIRDVDDWRVKIGYIRMNPVRAGLVERAEEWMYSSAGARFVVDPMPARYGALASGAKAQVSETITQGLKPLPPREAENGELTLDPIPQGLKPISNGVVNVGPKGPTPGALTEIVSAHPTQGLKPLPPKEAEKNAERSLNDHRGSNRVPEGSSVAVRAKGGGA